MAYFDKQSGHVRLHRLWAFVTLQGELAFPEHVHLQNCSECRAVMDACVEAENFGALLKALNRTDESDEDGSKAS